MDQISQRHLCIRKTNRNRKHSTYEREYQRKLPFLSYGKKRLNPRNKRVPEENRQYSLYELKFTLTSIMEDWNLEEPHKTGVDDIIPKEFRE